MDRADRVGVNNGNAVALVQKNTNDITLCRNGHRNRQRNFSVTSQSNVLFKHNRLAFGKGRRNLFSSRRKDSLYGPPRYAHPLAGLLLRKIIEVAELQRLELIMEERDLIDLRHRDSRGLESLSLEPAPAEPLFFMPRHVTSSQLCAYAHHHTGAALCCQGILNRRNVAVVQGPSSCSML